VQRSPVLLGGAKPPASRYAKSQLSGQSKTAWGAINSSGESMPSNTVGVVLQSQITRIPLILGGADLSSVAHRAKEDFGCNQAGFVGRIMAQ
jgi:hypothetical protein